MSLKKERNDMTDIYEIYKLLRKNTCHSYWEKRILSQLRYMMELLADREDPDWPLLEQAAATLWEDYRANGQIPVETAMAAEELLLPLSERAKRITMVCAAHAHIDMNWLWGFQETVALTLDTVRTMLKLLKEYPQFVFSQSQASVYRILEKYAPELLKQVKQRVQEGRWEVTASSWVENDKNMPSGESMARHLLYTKRYLSGLLDIAEESLNLDFEPDTFGHSANLPEILVRGGVTRYYHCRGYQGEHIYRWRGKSGAEVLAYREPRWYNVCIDSNLCQGIPDFCRKYGIDRILYVYGVGDHGGGPTRRDIESLLDMDAWPLFPRIRFGTYREYFDYLEEQKDRFPVVEQELNYVFTGCYTSQSGIKRANRVGEARLVEAEILESMARLEVPGYQRPENLEDAWRKLLFNQFHDIIPGCGTVDCREYALGEFQNIIARAGANGIHAMDAVCDALSEDVPVKADEDNAMGAGVGHGTDRGHNFGFSTYAWGSGSVRHFALFNVTQEVRRDPVELTVWDWQEDERGTRVVDSDGREYPFQMLEQGQGFWFHTYCKLLVWTPVPALGYKIISVKAWTDDTLPLDANYEGPRVDYITDAPLCLENDKVRAVFDAGTMKCVSFVRKSDGRKLVDSAKPAFGFGLITEETSNGMTAWRVGKTAAWVDLNETCAVRPEYIRTEGLRRELAYTIARDNLNLKVCIRLDEGSELLDFSLKIVWTMLGTDIKGIPQLRFFAPCGYEAEKYRYLIPGGVLDRSPLCQDVPALGLGCALHKGGGSALCLLSDCKYGFRGDGDGLSLNLIRATSGPDPYPEIGEHQIRIGAGACDPEERNLALLAERFIHPVITRSCGEVLRDKDREKSLFALEGAVLSAVKEAEDGNGFILRAYNPCGQARTVRFGLPGRKLKSAYLCDILESTLAPVLIEDEKTAVYEAGPYEMVSVRIIY